MTASFKTRFNDCLAKTSTDEQKSLKMSVKWAGPKNPL